MQFGTEWQARTCAAVLGEGGFCGDWQKMYEAVAKKYRNA